MRVFVNLKKLYLKSDWKKMFRASTSSYGVADMYYLLVYMHKLLSQSLSYLVFVISLIITREPALHLILSYVCTWPKIESHLNFISRSQS